MQEHLDSGCLRCRETVAWLTEVVRTADSEKTSDPPPELVKAAHAVFRAPESHDWIEALEKLAAELVFDTRTSLQPAGVRATETDCIRLIYKAGIYSVDLQVEAVQASLDIVGQITSEEGEKENLAGAIVQIVSGGQSVAETQTNQFGEFIIEKPPSRNAILRIALKRSAKRIDLPLENKL